MLGGSRLGLEVSFLNWFLYFSALPFCKSVTVMPHPTPPLLRSLCLSLITFFHLTALLVFSFSLPLFLCRPDQRWQ